MKTIIIIIIAILLIGCTNNPFDPSPTATEQTYNIMQVVTGFGDPVNISVANVSYLESQFPHTNYSTNKSYRGINASVEYSKVGTVSKLSMIIYTNGAIYSSNYAQGTNFKIESLVIR